MAAETVLIIASRADIAGGENYLLSIFQYMERTRFRPLVWLPGDGQFRAALDAAGVESIIESVDYGWLKPPQAWYRFGGGLSHRVRRLSALIGERNVRLVHTNSNQILEGALASRLAGVPHLYLAHLEFLNSLPIYQRVPLAPTSFARLMADLSEGILAVSQHVADSLIPTLGAGRVSVVHNGIETDRFDAAVNARDGSLRPELGLPESALLVTAAGRITHDKGFDVLLDAAARLTPAYPDLHFLIAGATDSADCHAQLERLRQALGLQARVHWLGRRDDLPRVMAQSDIFLLTSRREGHPYVLLEAMACACPVVASRCGGVAETVVDGQTGFIVDVADADATADRLRRLLDDAGLRQAMGAAGRIRVATRFTARQTALGLFAKYEELLAGPAPAPGSPTIDLFLQAADELSALGQRQLELDERLRKVEGVVSLFTRNPFERVRARLRGK